MTRHLGGYIDILSENFDDELVQTFERISGSRFQKRLKQPKNLGELMAITFAVDHAESGALVYLIIDDQDGVRLARKEIGSFKKSGQKCRENLHPGNVLCVGESSR